MATTTSYPLHLKNQLNTELKKYNKKKDFLRRHQYLVHKFVINNPESRGLLIFHETGTGKSIMAVSLAEYYRKQEPERKIIVLLSKSLQKNFKQNITKYLKEFDDSVANTEIEDIVEKEYNFVSINAYNMYTQLYKTGKTKDQIEFEKKLEEFAEMSKGDFLENTVLIIDEFHNFSNSITNGSKNAIQLYDRIMKTQDIKLIFLTGTPIVNSPFELVPTFNMLKGQMQLGRSLEKFNLFPETYQDFAKYFINEKKFTIKNKAKFQNRIFGLSTYYGDLYFGEKTKEDYPEELPLKIEKINMSPAQFSQYDAARTFEIEEASAGKRKSSGNVRFAAVSGSSSYRIKSRLASNFILPEHALGPTRGNKIRKKYVNKLTRADLKNELLSPKMHAILKNIKSKPTELHLVYSEFVSGEGLGIFSKILEIFGYESFKEKTSKSLSDFDLDSESSIAEELESEQVFRGGGILEFLNELHTIGKKYCLENFTGGKSNYKDIKTNSTKPLKKYAIISGLVDIEDRSRIIEKFNEPINKNGKNIHVLLISRTGAEGLDLKNVRNVHIMEPFWNYARIHQIIARAVRFKSHTELPKKDQKVQPYLYLSDYPKEHKRKVKEFTTDIDMFNNALNTQKIIQKFYLAIAESSIDCSVHYQTLSKSIQKKINCLMCYPSDEPLYKEKLYQDMNVSNPCKPLEEETVTVSEIMIPDYDEKFYFSKLGNNITLYTFQEKIQGYKPMKQNHPLYAVLLKKILKLKD